MVALDTTIVVGIDRKTVEQFVVSFPTWLAWKPEIARLPFLIFYDPSSVHGVQHREVQRIADQIEEARSGYAATPRPLVVEWSGSGVTQRERQLAGFIHVPAEHVLTAYWTKIDTDAIAFNSKLWIPQLDTADKAPKPVLVASGWGYTKPANQMEELDNWADRHKLFTTPRLNLPFDPQASRCIHSRIASWICFVDTAWNKKVALDCAIHCGRTSIPVPSQDGLHWYMAARGGESIMGWRFKRYGWTNVPRYARLVDQARDALATKTDVWRFHESTLSVRPS